MALVELLQKSGESDFLRAVAVSVIIAPRGAQVRGPSARLGAYDVAGKFPHRVIYPPVRRQGFRDNGLGKLREALAHRVGEVRQPAAGAASGD